jgi:glycosyltransferase involved in cell wall biosynthesis
LPSISVIVPVYNVEKYLAQCVESLLAQTFSDLEILLVNDASTDGSLEAARKYETADRRVRVLDKPHGGLGDTRNYGAARATGKYLVFVDSDDWVDDDMMQNLYAAAESYRAELVVYNFVRENLDAYDHRVCRLPVNYPEFGDEIREKLIAELIGPDHGDGEWRNVEMLGSVCRRMFLRSWFMENGLSFGNEQEIMLEDLPVSIMAHCLAGRVLVVGGAFYHYRYNPLSLSTRYRPRRMEMLTKCFLLVDRFLREQGLDGRYGERHSAWFLRYAAHSALVNCFVPAEGRGFGERWREVRGILGNQVLRRAARSDYLKEGNRADRVVLRVLRTGNVFLAYSFYRFYSAFLRKEIEKNKK